MKKEQCLSLIEKRQLELERQFNFISNIPIGIPLLLTIDSYVVHSNGGWKHESIKVIGTVNTFNSMSIRFNICAVNNVSAYPFSRDIPLSSKDRMFHTTAFPFKRILYYEEVPKQDLPLYIGWPVTYPKLSELLKG